MRAFGSKRGQNQMISYRNGVKVTCVMWNRGADKAETMKVCVCGGAGIKSKVTFFLHLLVSPLF